VGNTALRGLGRTVDLARGAVPRLDLDGEVEVDPIVDLDPRSAVGRR